MNVGRRLFPVGSALAPAAPISYLMAYNGQTGSGAIQIGIAQSEDTYTWTKLNPSQGVIRPGSGWESTSVFQPAFVKVGTGDYRIWYVGYNGTNEQVGVAMSADTKTWGKYNSNPVIANGSGGTWDAVQLNNPVVLYEPSDVSAPFKMWCAGLNAAPGTGTFQIGYFYSTDGYSWTAYSGNPVVANGVTYDSTTAAPGGIFKSGSTYYLFYYASSQPTNVTANSSVCLATFTNPQSSYTKAAGNPILSPSTAEQALTANLTSGTQTVTVTSTSAFHAGEPCLLLDSTNTQADVVVDAINSGTQLTLTALVTRSWTTANTATIRSAYYESLEPRTIVQTGTGYLMYLTAYQQFLGSPLSERVAAATSSSLGSGWSFDYTRGLMLPLGTVWDSESAENPSVIQL